MADSNRKTNRGLAAVTLIVFAALLALLTTCRTGSQNSTESGASKPPLTATQLSSYRFSPEEASSIVGNAMHQAHNQKNGVECQRCHRGPKWITHEEALALCMECHDSQIVAAEVWHNHCLSCHQFANYKEKYASSVHILRELCQDCHGLDSVIYTAFDPSSPHDVTCANCHHPHKTSLVVGGKICKDCHKDIAKLTTVANKVHGSCLVCHTPHSPMKPSSELCSKCHNAGSDILVHNVPAHPKDCLACHQAHFTTPEIGNKACLVCHDDTYYGGESNLPKQHRDCNNCHYPSDFVYRGDKVCVSCHGQTKNVLTNASLPKEHTRCTTCHKPHQWYANYELGCKKCHDVGKVLEHNLTFHQKNCKDCHNPHDVTIMAKSGNCNGCHKDRKYPTFAASTPEQHLVCANCHDQASIDSRSFVFLGPERTCMVCHPQSDAKAQADWTKVPFGHQVCSNCHEAHTFNIASRPESCSQCHVDLYAKVPPQQHAECFNCHTANHSATFVGYSSSCDKCHAQESSDLAVNAGHPADCTQCHSVHGGVTQDTCKVCHASQPGLHQKHNTTMHCEDCHSTHKFGAGYDSCKVCHAQPPASCTSLCADCHAFKGAFKT